MPRPPGVYWHKHTGCYASNSGVSENGKRRTLYFHGIPKSDKRAALAALQEYHANRASQEKAADTPDVAAVVERYLLHSEKTSKPRTFESHAEMLGKFLEYIPKHETTPYGDRRAREMKAGDVTRMLRAWEDAGYSPHYRARLLRSIKACWTWAAAADQDRKPERLIPENPFRDIKGIKILRAPERYAERSEIAAFLRFAWRKADEKTGIYRRFRRLAVLAIRVAVHTGARPGEICEAQWSDFDPEKRTIVLPPHRHKTGGKTGKPRTIFLTPILVHAILREKARKNRHPVYIFTHRRAKDRTAPGSHKEQGQPWESRIFSRMVSAIRKDAIAAGVPLQERGPNAFTMYRLRHTRISEAIMQGVPSAVAAAMTGTSEQMIAQTYGHVLDARIQEAADFLHRNPRKKTGE